MNETQFGGDAAERRAGLGHAEAAATATAPEWAPPAWSMVEAAPWKDKFRRRNLAWLAQSGRD